MSDNSKKKKVLIEKGCKKALGWACLCMHRQQGLFPSAYVDDIEHGRKEEQSENGDVKDKQVTQCQQNVDVRKRPQS